MFPLVVTEKFAGKTGPAEELEASIPIQIVLTSILRRDFNIRCMYLQHWRNLKTMLACYSMIN